MKKKDKELNTAEYHGTFTDMFESDEFIDDDCKDKDYEYQKKISNHTTAKRDALIKSLLHERLGEFALVVQQYWEDEINYIPQQNYMSIHNAAAASLRFEV